MSIKNEDRTANIPKPFDIYDVEIAESEAEAESVKTWKPLQPLANKTTASSITVPAVQRFAIGNRYYESVLDQSRHSFRWALITAIIGFLFFLIASVALFVEQSKEFSYIPLIGGAIAEFISAVNFFLYSRASSQLTTFHQRLEGAQQYINIFNLADDICEKIQGNLRDEIRAELVRKIAELPEKISTIAEYPINNKSGTNHLDSKTPHSKARHKKIEPAKDGSTPKQNTNSPTG